jgi:hypothetical protein
MLAINGYGTVGKRVADAVLLRGLHQRLLALDQDDSLANDRDVDVVPFPLVEQDRKFLETQGIPTTILEEPPHHLLIAKTILDIARNWRYLLSLLVHVVKGESGNFSLAASRMM